MVHYVVYKDPADYPDRFVVRRWTIGQGELFPEREPVAVTLTLEGARSVIPAGLHRIERLPKDDPCIAEVWI